MTFVLSNGFKGLLLSSYINFKYELAIKSFEELIDKKSVDIVYDNIFKITEIENSTEMILLRNKFFNGSSNTKMIYKERANSIETIRKEKNIIRFKRGQFAILCLSYNCPKKIISNPHLNLQFTEDRYFFNYDFLIIRSTHSHANQIRRA